MKILFRADSSSQIGLGHIMRDLVLATQFKDANITFACQKFSGNIIDKIPYKVEILDSNDIGELILLIQKLDIEMIIFDHYSIDYIFEKRIRDRTNVKILSFDDTYKKHYCDILLNHNISANSLKYKNLVPVWCELRCGSKYTLIRDEFIKEKKRYPKNIKNRIKTIFLAMGGSDHRGMTLEILKLLKFYKNIKVTVVTTTSNSKLKQIKKFIYLNKFIRLYVDSQEIASLMKKSDFMIVTPSVMVHEVLFLKKPFIAIKTVDNQNDIYQYLKKKRFLVTNDVKKITQLVKFM